MSNLQVSNNNEIVATFLRNFTSEHTQRAYYSDLKSFFSSLSRVGLVFADPSEISLTHFIYFRDLLTKEGRSSKTVSRKLSSVKSFWSWMHEQGYIKTNPCASLKIRKSSVKTPTNALTDEEVRKMLASPDVTSYKGKLHKLILELLFNTGVRRSELCGIKVRDISLIDDYTVISVNGKGGKQRSMPVSDSSAKALGQYLSSRKFSKEDFLLQAHESFTSFKPMDSTTIYKVVKRYAEESGINKQVSPHACRATAITKAIEAGCVITDVAEFAGHSSIETTQIYYKNRHKLKNSPSHKITF